MPHVPGSNLLRQAFLAIKPEIIQYLRFKGRVVNGVGQWVEEFFPAVDVRASEQAFNRATYVQFGLDLQRQYKSVYVEIDVISLGRGLAGDKFIMSDGKIYQVESEMDWFLMDGWSYCLCVQVKDL